MINRLRQVRKSRDLTQEELGHLVGATKGQISKFETGGQGLNEAWIQRLAKALKINPVELFDDGYEVNFLKAVGEVQAGIWREALQWDFEDQISIPVVRDAGLENAYALRVAGDSMDKYYQEGDFLIVIPLDDYSREPETGDHVIVERHKRDGLTEATVKELVVIDGKAQLWCRSNNPKFQNGPLEIHWPYVEGQKHDTEIVEIKAVVDSMHRKRKK